MMMQTILTCRWRRHQRPTTREASASVAPPSILNQRTSDLTNLLSTPTDHRSIDLDIARLVVEEETLHGRPSSRHLLLYKTLLSRTNPRDPTRRQRVSRVPTAPIASEMCSSSLIWPWHRQTMTFLSTMIRRWRLGSEARVPISSRSRSTLTLMILTIIICHLWLSKRSLVPTSRVLLICQSLR